MIRRATPDDTAAVIEMAVATGMFPADETEILHRMMGDYFGGKINDGDVCVIDEEEKPLGVAYYAPAPATDGTWTLVMLAVHPEVQGRGRGTALMRAMEQQLRAQGQRIVLVETSGTSEYDLTRQFYAKCGYGQEARVRDYYAAGADMILFRKALDAG
ncbi:N-acetyltransferase family protein [Deinococcus sp.]|uniref:GNAT family N-acetyltransferase n=1 Tax=Deinococcus sp. TaxID=47478 RepID=UPI003CC5A836